MVAEHDRRGSEEAELTNARLPLRLAFRSLWLGIARMTATSRLRLEARR